MKILFIGDIVGNPGRRAVARWLPEIRQKHAPDIVIANAENAAGGLGATPSILQELKDYGIDGFTMGNHTWRKKAIIPAVESMAELVRPPNYPPGNPGRGAAVIRGRDGQSIGLLNLLGRIFMEPLDCPFRQADHELKALSEQTCVILVDMHAEATSEKVAMGWHLDGRCTAIVGTHTHVQTADERLLPEGSAYITDVGMCGPYNAVIGTDRQPVLEKFITGMPRHFEVAKGPLQFCAVLITADGASGRAEGIERIQYREM